MASPGNNNSGERPALRVDVSGPTLSNLTRGSPPPLALASTTSTSATTVSEVNLFPPKTPVNQSINQPMSKEERARKAREFMASKELRISYDNLDDDGKLRANRLMSKDFSWSPNQRKRCNRETTFHEQWDLFISVQEEWKDFSGVFFDEEALENFLVIRLQKAGICYMHAVTVFQHYLSIIRHTRMGQDHIMLDLSWYIRERFPNWKLEKFLRDGGGGSTLEFFCEITGSDLDTVRGESFFLVAKNRNPENFDEKMDKICKQFEKNKEPALVSEFKVEKDFTTPNKFEYDGEVDPQAFYSYGRDCDKADGVRVLHSMILLGLKKDDDSGKVWFLLQNFWAKYLVVVSGEYLASCFAIVTFAPKTANVTLLDRMETINAHFSETEVGPEEDQYCPEESAP